MANSSVAIELMMRGLFYSVVVSAYMFVTSVAANAGYERPTPGVPDKNGVLWDTPVYEPVTKKYYALIWAHNPKDVYLGVTWETADALAKAREYKGARGRLAIVDTVEVHQFLERTFHPDEPTWIGLRYACSTRTLWWADGRKWKPGFQAWDANWRQDVYACKSGDPAKDFMPVAYSAIDKGFKWIGKGKNKQFNGYFIEFPTGAP